jgi:hypothetical protein
MVKLQKQREGLKAALERGKFQRPMIKLQKPAEKTDDCLENPAWGSSLAFGVLRFGVFLA